MKRMCAGLGLACTVAWTLSTAAANDGAVERIVHLDEMDHLANRTALLTTPERNGGGLMRVDGA